MWNNRDFTGWERCLGVPHPTVVLPGTGNDRGKEPLGLENDPLQVFTVVRQDGEPAIRISGQIFGSISHREDFSNYHLRLEIKWGSAKWPPREHREKRDSGLLYHAHTPMNRDGKLWPLSLEYQIMERELGDFYGVGAQISVRATAVSNPDGRALYRYEPSANPLVFVPRGPHGHRCLRGLADERPFGEWNSLELVCLGTEAVHVVNGTVVMRLSNATRVDGTAPVPLSSGRIHILSEGAELFIRKIELRPIRTIPSKFGRK